MKASMVIFIQYITLALSEVIEEDQLLFNVHVFICVLKHTDVNMPLWRVSMWEAAVEYYHQTKSSQYQTHHPPILIVF